MAEYWLVKYILDNQWRTVALFCGQKKRLLYVGLIEEHNHTIINGIDLNTNPYIHKQF